MSRALFDAVQEAFEPKRTGTKSFSHVFALRDWLYCSECGCKITAEHQKDHTYYRCTHGKRRDKRSQRTYTRQELLFEQTDAILASIRVPEDIMEALLRDSKPLRSALLSAGGLS